MLAGASSVLSGLLRLRSSVAFSARGNLVHRATLAERVVGAVYASPRHLLIDGRLAESQLAGA
jgi:hypothetical protein